jgi:HPt (histidine-containing phosphotransfer) domain-containing protein
MGDIEDSYFKYLDYALPRRAKPDLDVAIIDYIDLTDELKEAISAHIRKRFNFEHIIFQKVSSVMSLNCGRGAMGIMYIMKKDEPYSLSQMLASVLHGEEEEIVEEHQEVTNTYAQEAEAVQEKELIPEQPQQPPKEPEWYETIPGIDPVKAIENSGSEDSFKAVLKIFYNSISDRSKEIEDYYNTEDWENYTIKVHALKSSARLVGAMELSKNALALEDAGKAGNVDFIKENTEKLLADFRCYEGLLHDFFAEPEEEQKEEPPKPEIPQNYDRFIIDSVYSTIKDAASKQDDKVIERTLKEIADYSFPPEDVERLDKIKAAFGEKDYDEIIKLSGVV